MNLTEEEYRTFFSKVPRLCVDLIIDADNRVLIGKRNHEPYKDMYGLIGGVVEMGESIEKTLKRKALEEIGVEIGRFEFVGFSEFLDEIEKVNTHSVSLNFVVEVLSELNGFDDFSFTEITTNRHVDESLIIPQHLKIINKYLENAPQYGIKQHDLFKKKVFTKITKN